MKINLTSIGHDENIIHEITHKDEWLAQKFPEAILDGDLPEIIHPPIPDWLPIREKKPWWKIFNLLVI